MQRILVTGGAGYIGSHTVRLLAAEGYQTWVYDNLTTGHPQAVPQGQLIEGELSDQARLAAVMQEKKIEAVIHFAASALVGESVENPAKYYGNNVLASYTLLEAMRATGVQRIVFSSTTATYGAPQNIPIRETEPQRPINPYGYSKLVIEQMLRDYRHAYGLGYAALRYFNAAGAAADAQLGEDHQPESHLIPLVLQVALGQRDGITVFGDDYPTADGTCIRDYVHVEDLAVAHRLALDRLEPGGALELNLGTGRGHSVAQVIEACRRVTGHPIPAQRGARRLGDPPVLVADASLAGEQLGWKPSYTELEDIVSTAWEWHRRHPHGYREK